MAVLINIDARAELLNRLRRAEGQIRGVQRMIEEGENCLKIGQQFTAVRKALDSTYLRMTMCFMEQELANFKPSASNSQEDYDALLQEMKTLLASVG